MNPKTDGRILPPADENDKKSNDVLFPLGEKDGFWVETLRLASGSFGGVWVEGALFIKF